MRDDLRMRWVGGVIILIATMAIIGVDYLDRHDLSFVNTGLAAEAGTEQKLRFCEGIVAPDCCASCIAACEAKHERLLDASHDGQGCACECSDQMLYVWDDQFT